MQFLFPILIAASPGHAYWYPNSYTRTPSPDEDCYSEFTDPYSITCHRTNDFVYAPCSDLFIPSTPSRPNNFTYRAICNYPYAGDYPEADFWSDIITVGVCETYWDACISDNILAKYDEQVEYGRTACRGVTDSACGDDRVDEETTPGSEPEDTTLGAFDLGPYSTVSQVTMPRASVASTCTDGSSSSKSGLGATGVTAAGASSASRTSSSATITGASESAQSQSTAASASIPAVTSTSKAGRMSTAASCLRTAVYVAGLSVLISLA